MNNNMMITCNDRILHETAARLIKALGVDMAITVCRSNYWHGVMTLIERQHDSLDLASSGQASDEPSRLHSLPHARPERATDRQLAIAA